MPKRKVDTLNNTLSSMGAKKARQDQTTTDPTQKNLSTLIGGEYENGSDSDAEENGMLLGKPSFTINEEYARRFEHNKKREELQRCKFAWLVEIPKILTSLQ
jgi:protein KRI1